MVAGDAIPPMLIFAMAEQSERLTNTVLTLVGIGIFIALALAWLLDLLIQALPIAVAILIVLFVLRHCRL